MKKIIRLTESDLTRIVKRVIQEQTVPAKPISNKPTPVKPKPPTKSKTQTLNQKSPNFWDDLIKKSFVFPFQINLYHKNDPFNRGDKDKFMYQVTVTGIKYNGDNFILDVERSGSSTVKSAKGFIYMSDCNSTYFVSKLKYPQLKEPEAEVIINDDFLLYFRDKVCMKSQYNSDELVPKVGPGGFGSVNRNNSDRYTA